MNEVGIAMVWCAVQVTAIAALAVGLITLSRRAGPSAGVMVVLTSLVVILALSMLAFSPWPSWRWVSQESREEVLPAESPAPIAARAAESSAAAASTPEVAEPPVHGRTPSPAVETFYLGALWRAFSEALTAPPATAEAASWRWSGVVAVLIAGGIAVGAIWLVMGLLAVGSYVRRSEPVRDAGLRQLAETLRAELGCPRRVEVRQSAALVTAATVGWRRPAVLLPADWPRWTGAQRRAVLAHEIAHVCHRDFPACLCAQLGLVLHFYHPLVHWLVRRLRLEQELAADAMAAGVLGGQRPYLRTIAELALQQDDRPMLWPARFFLPTRGTFLRRLEMLRYHKPDWLWGARVARALAAVLLIVCGVGVAGLRSPAREAAAPSPEAPAGQAHAPPEAEESEGSVPAADEPDDRAYLPPDAGYVIEVRPADIPRLQGVLAALSGDEGLPPVYGIPFAKYERILLGSQWPKGPPGGLPMGVTVIMRMVDAEASQQLADSAFADAVPKEINGRVYYTAGQGQRVKAYVRLDERTIAIDHPERLARVLDFSKSDPPGVAAGEPWGDMRGCQVAIAVDVPFLQTLLQQAHATSIRGSDLSIVTSNLADLLSPWDELSTAVLGVRIAEKTEVRLTLACRDEQGAGRVKEAFEGVLGKRSAVDRVLERPEGGTVAIATGKPEGNVAQKMLADAWKQRQRPSRDLIFVLELADLLMKQARVEQQGALLRVRTAIDTEAWTRPLAAQRAAAREEEVRLTRSRAQLARIAGAMLLYHETSGRLPPAVLYGPDGKTPHSWRVALLPFLGERELYDQYRLNEPWDSEHNRQLLEKMPQAYRYPSHAADPTHAAYFVLTGPETVFSGKAGLGLSDIRDPADGTILVVEAKRPVPWTKPEDIPYDSGKPVPELGGFHKARYNVAFCDGSVRRLPLKPDEKLLRAMITKAGGENTGRLAPVP